MCDSADAEHEEASRLIEQSEQIVEVQQLPRDREQRVEEHVDRGHCDQCYCKSHLFPRATASVVMMVMMMMLPRSGIRRWSRRR